MMPDRIVRHERNGTGAYVETRYWDRVSRSYCAVCGTCFGIGCEHKGTPAAHRAAQVFSNTRGYPSDLASLEDRDDAHEPAGGW